MYLVYAPDLQPQTAGERYGILRLVRDFSSGSCNNH